jgi:competence ComEA-like helix-hairpin-helix protein
MTFDRIAPFLATLFLVLCLSACAKRSRSISIPAPDQHTAQTQTTTRININTASAKELETLPGIGESLAQRIIEHRQKYGPFRRAEHLMMVRGISDHRFRALRDSITVESGSLR